MLRLMTCVVVLGLGTSSFAQEHTKDSLDKVKQMLADKKAVLVDVREQREWDAGHVEGAILLPLSKLDKGVEAATLQKLLPKDAVIYLHCAAGARCLTAAEILKPLGYETRPLKDGFKALVKAGFPAAKK